MVAAESQFEIPERDEIYIVSLRKYAARLHLSWYALLYLHLIWLPVVRFGFKRMGIACPSALRPDGSIEFFEEIGAYWNESEAKAACKDDNYSVKPFPLNITLPAESVQYKGHVTPRSILPDRYRRRYFPGVVVGTATQAKELTETLKSLSRTAAGQQ